MNINFRVSVVMGVEEHCVAGSGARELCPLPPVQCLLGPHFPQRLT